MNKKYQIYCDYKKAIEKATELEKLSRDISKLAEEDVRNETNMLDKYWKGTGKDIFGSKLNVTADDIMEISRRLKQTANTIKIIAQKNYSAEMKALEIAQKRSSS